MGTSSKADRQFDAVIAGCGSAGTTAAKRLRADGQTVAVVEMDQPWGDCPLRACVPTKALLRSAQIAHYQGRVAAANMFAGTPVRSDYRVVPRVTFTEPPIAGVGLTEEQAHATSRDVRCALVEVASLGKALVESDANGLVKLIADAGSGEILGGHIAAAAAGEMIHEVVAAMAAHATVRDLAEAIHAFPNFAERVKAAARQWVAARQNQPPTEFWLSSGDEKNRTRITIAVQTCGVRVRA